MSIRPFRWQLLIVAVLLMMIGFETGASQAAYPNPDSSAAIWQTNQTQCVPVDMVLVIDQSASNTTTDPNGLRIDAARAVVDSLYFNAALNCEGIVTHRLAIIGFNETVQVLQEPIEIFVPDAASNDWVEASSAVKANLRSDPVGQTNMAQALILNENSAVNILNSLPTEGDAAIREQIIFLVTDGNPCTNATAAGAGGATNYCASVRWVEHYFLANNGSIYTGDPSLYFFELEDGLVSELINTVGSNVRFNVVSFNRSESSRFPEVAGAWSEVATARSGQYVELDIDDGISEVTRVTEDVLDEVLTDNSESAGCDEDVIIEPYSSTTIVSAVRPNVESNLEIIQPNGVSITPSTYLSVSPNIEYIRLDTIERYIIADPIPGAWQITSSDPALCDEIEAQFDTVAFEANIQLPEASEVVVERDAPFYVTNSQAFIELRVNDIRFDAPLVEQPGFPLNVCGRVTGPIDRGADGITASEYPTDGSCITFSNAEPGLWVSDTPVPAPYQGTYELRVNVTTPSVDGNSTVERYTSEVLTYTTAPPIDIGFSPVSPLPDEETGRFVWALNGFDIDTTEQIPNDLPVAIQVVADGTPLNANEVFRGIEDNAIEAVLTGPTQETITLTVDENDPTTWRGVLRDGTTSLDPEGNYALSFQLNSDAQANYNSENYTFTATTTPSVDIRGVELEGVLLSITSWETQVLYNNIVNGAKQNIGLPIEVQMSNQAGEPVTPGEVFGSSANFNQLVQAQLIGPNNAVVETITLDYDATDNRFEGTLLDDLDLTGVPGDHRVEVRFADDAGLPTDKQLEYTLVTTTDQLVSDTVTRVPREGVRLQMGTVRVAGVSYADGATDVPLNNVVANSEGVYEQEEIPMTIEVQLVDIEGNVITDFSSVFIDGVNLENIVSVNATGPSGARDNAFLVHDGDGNWTAELFTDSDRGDINAPGEYTFTVFVANSAFSGEPLAGYELLLDEGTYRVTRVEQIGVSLELVRLGDTDEGFAPAPFVPDAEVESVETIPLHNTQSEAMGSILNVNDDDPRAVPFEFTIVDTNGESIEWTTLVDSSITPAPAITDVIDISVVDENGNSVPISELSSERKDGRFVIVGEIDNQATSSGTYQLTYSLNTMNADNVSLFNPQTDNLSNERLQIAFTRQTVSFSDDFLLNPDFWNYVAYFIWFVIAVIIVRLLILNVPYFPIPWLNGRISGSIAVKYEREQREPKTLRMGVPLRFVLVAYRTSYTIPDTTIKVKITVKRSGWGRPSDSSSSFDPPPYAQPGRPGAGGSYGSSTPSSPPPAPKRRVPRYQARITVIDGNSTGRERLIQFHQGEQVNKQEFEIQHLG